MSRGTDTIAIERGFLCGISLNLKKRKETVMKIRRVLAFALAMLMVFALLGFVGCGSEEKKTQAVSGEENTAQEADPNSVYDAEVKDLKGHTFIFLSRSTSYDHLDTNEVYAEELTGDKVNDAVYKRNTLLQEKYNCEIFEERQTDVVAAAKDALVAGDYAYDYIYAGVSQMRSFAASGLLADFNKLKNLNLDKTWWDQNMRSGLAIRGKLFYMNGDAGTCDDRSASVVYYNRDAIKVFNQEDPMDLVEQGTWTIQKMYEIGEACVQDKNGDGAMTVGTDVFAQIFPASQNWYFVAACNQRVSSLADNGDLVIEPTLSKELLDVWAELKPLLTTPHREVTDSGYRFRRGLGVFYTMNLGFLLHTEDADSDFGVIPLPKRNAEQKEYWTTIQASACNAYGITLVSNQNEEAAAAGFTGDNAGVEMAAYFLEAYAYHSVDTLTPAFFNDVLKHQMVRDTRSAEMIEFAVKNRVYDPVMMYSFGGMGKIFDKAGSNGSGGTGNSGDTAIIGSDVNYDTLNSLYQSLVTPARKALKNYLEYLEQEDVG